MPANIVSSSKSPIPAPETIPALLTRISSLPKASTAGRDGLRPERAIGHVLARQTAPRRHAARTAPRTRALVHIGVPIDRAHRSVLTRCVAASPRRFRWRSPSTMATLPLERV